MFIKFIAVMQHSVQSIQYQCHLLSNPLQVHSGNQFSRYLKKVVTRGSGEPKLLQRFTCVAVTTANKHITTATISCLELESEPDMSNSTLGYLESKEKQIKILINQSIKLNQVAEM